MSSTTGSKDNQLTDTIDPDTATKLAHRINDELDVPDSKQIDGATLTKLHRTATNALASNYGDTTTISVANVDVSTGQQAAAAKRAFHGLHELDLSMGDIRVLYPQGPQSNGQNWVVTDR